MHSHKVREIHAAPAPETKTRVMVVSPLDEDVISLLAIFSHTNWTGYWWTSCRDALETLREQAVPVLVASEDVPDGDWRTLLAQIKTLPEPPRFILAARGLDDARWAEALDLGAHDVLSKPYDAGEVIQVISLACRSWHAGHRGTATNARLATSA